MKLLLFQFFPRERERERKGERDKEEKSRREEEREENFRIFDWVKRKLKTYFSQKILLA